MGLNESQTRYLVETFRYFDESLASVSCSISGETNSHALCPEFVLDVPAEKQDALKPELAAFRDRLSRFLTEEQIAVEPTVSAQNALATTIRFVNSSLEEIEPTRLLAYGPMNEITARALLGLITDLREIVARMTTVCSVKRQS